MVKGEKETIKRNEQEVTTSVPCLGLGGLTGKKSTPSIHWEVLVRSHKLESESRTEQIYITCFIDYNFFR
jgi:hypothetical protein